MDITRRPTPKSDWLYSLQWKMEKLYIVGKTRPRADCGSDNKLLVAEFRLKLRKVRKITRPLRYDLHQFPYGYTVEQINRLELHIVPEELWKEVWNTVQEAVIKTILMERVLTHAEPSLCLCGVPKNPNLRPGNCLDLGISQNLGLVLDNTLQSDLEPEQCRPGKHMGCERGQTHCSPYTECTTHTHQWYLFVVFLPLHSTAEQLSLSKWPPLTSCAKVEIRHWRDLQTEEAKIKRELLWKWQVQQIKFCS